MRELRLSYRGGKRSYERKTKQKTVEKIARKRSQMASPLARGGKGSRSKWGAQKKRHTTINRVKGGRGHFHLCSVYV